MEQELLSTQAAAELINQELPQDGGTKYWTRFLTNNRREDREPPHRLPHARIGKGAFYQRTDIAEFIEFEKNRRLGTLKLTGRAAEALRAFGIGEAGGSTTGRKLTYTLTAQVDPATGRHYAQFITRDPLMVFRLEPEQVQAFASELGELAANFKRWEGGK